MRPSPARPVVPHPGLSASPQERLGDELMLHLLLHASIFVPLVNNNYMQVTGRPIWEASGAVCVGWEGAGRWECRSGCLVG